MRPTMAEVVDSDAWCGGGIKLRGARCRLRWLKEVDGCWTARHGRLYTQILAPRQDTEKAEFVVLTPPVDEIHELATTATIRCCQSCAMLDIRLFSRV